MTAALWGPDDTAHSPSVAVKKVLLMICAGIGAYQLYSEWKEHKANREYEAFVASEPANRSPSPSGFKDAMVPDGVSPYVVTLLMPVGCPLEAGRRGRALIEKLKAADIPVTATAEAHVSVKARSKEELDNMIAMANKLMTGDTPIVFYKGRAKNNPSYDDVVAEYQSAK
jgi:hypothetical protein